MQCGSCRENFLATIPALVDEYARPGDVKILMRHYSVAQNPLELGFFGSEAAAEQGYGWQYTYLFFRNQGEAERFGDRRRVHGNASPARSANSNIAEWKEDLESEGGGDGPDRQRARSLRRARHAISASAPSRRRSSAGPTEPQTLQDGPSLRQVERAIGEVGGDSDAAVLAAAPRIHGGVS